MGCILHRGCVCLDLGVCGGAARSLQARLPLPPPTLWGPRTSSLTSCNTMSTPRLERRKSRSGRSADIEAPTPCAGLLVRVLTLDGNSAMTAPLASPRRSLLLPAGPSRSRGARLRDRSGSRQVQPQPRPRLRPAPLTLRPPSQVPETETQQRGGKDDSSAIAGPDLAPSRWLVRPGPLPAPVPLALGIPWIPGTDPRNQGLGRLVELGTPIRVVGWDEGRPFMSPVIGSPVLNMTDL